MPDLTQRETANGHGRGQRAVTGLKAAKDLLQVALRTKVAVESVAQIGTALERLGEVQDKLFDLRRYLANEASQSSRPFYEHAEVPRRYAGPATRSARPIDM